MILLTYSSTNRWSRGPDGWSDSLEVRSAPSNDGWRTVVELAHAHVKRDDFRNRDGFGDTGDGDGEGDGASNPALGDP